MNDSNTFSNRHGSLTMSREGQIIIARFSGAVNASILRFFYDNLMSLSEELVGSPWGFLNASEHAFAATGEAEELLIKAGIEGHQRGCVQAAYVLNSPVAMAQTNKIRAAIGITQPLEEVLFASEAKAKEYLHAWLANYAPQA